MKILPLYFIFAVLYTVPFLCRQGYSQETDYIKVQRPVPLSPRAAELSRYISYPAGEFSGDLAVPFSLSYHAGGIRVTQRETEVGLGWSVRGGGIITRSVGAVPDDRPVQGAFADPPYSLGELMEKKSTSDPAERMANFQEIRQILTGEGKDMRPDLFFYDMGTESGAFYRSGTLFRKIPFSEASIRHGALDSNSVHPFELRDNVSGYVYTYGAYTTTSPGGPDSNNAEQVTSWHLTGIRTSDGSKQIRISYASREVTETVRYQEQSIGRDFVFSAPTVQTSSYTGTIRTFEDTVVHREQRLKEIVSDETKVHFHYTDSTGLLSRILLRSVRDDRLIRVINLYYNTGDPDRDRTKLLALEFMSPYARELTERYGFSYSPVQLPSLSEGDGRYAQDY